MKILILRFSSIGDIVLTTPVIRTLKTQLESAEIHFATKAGFASIVKENPYIDHLHLLKSGDKDLIRELKQEKFDVIVDLHNNLRTRRISMALGVKTYRFDKLNLQKWLLTNFKVDMMPNKHIVDRYFEAIAPLGVKSDTLGLDYFIPEKDEVPSDWLPNEYQNGYTTVVIGATYSTKRLPTERIIELCDRINRPIVLIGGKEDVEAASEIEAFFAHQTNQIPSEEDLEIDLGKRALIFNACGKFNLNQSACLIRDAQYVFSHDTGMMHIAAAFKKQVFSIWGNTTPKFGMYPYRTQFVVFENNKLDCRPCSKIGHDKCPKGHFKCMNEMVFDFYLPE